jgi:hypothetical protein
MDRPELLVLTREQFRYKKCAEQKEYGTAQIAEKANVIQPEMLRRIDSGVIHAMHGEDADKREEAQNIQFRPVVWPLGGRQGGKRCASEGRQAGELWPAGNGARITSSYSS